MDIISELGITLAIGICIGYLLSRIMSRAKSGSPDTSAESKNWWEARKRLTGTQLQILKYMDGKKEASIIDLQEEFSFIPDRELYYRLEQICLMEFLVRGRQSGDVSYSLNEGYSATVEDDSTIVLPN